MRAGAIRPSCTKAQRYSYWVSARHDTKRIWLSVQESAAIVRDKLDKIGRTVCTSSRLAFCRYTAKRFRASVVNPSYYVSGIRMPSSHVSRYLKVSLLKFGCQISRGRPVRLRGRLTSDSSRGRADDFCLLSSA